MDKKFVTTTKIKSGEKGKRKVYKPHVFVSPDMFIEDEWKSLVESKAIVEFEEPALPEGAVEGADELATAQLEVKELKEALAVQKEANKQIAKERDGAVKDLAAANKKLEAKEPKAGKDKDGNTK